MLNTREIYNRIETETKNRMKALHKEFSMPMISRQRCFDWDSRPIYYWEYSFKHFYFPIHVAEDFIGNYRISTIWLGLDHSFFPTQKPLIFETIIFVENESMKVIEELKGYQERYSYLDEAEVGHKIACDTVEALLKVEQ